MAHKNTNKNSKIDDIWKKLNFKYKLSATNESTLEEIWKFKTSMFWGGVLFLIFAFMLIVATSAIIITTPIRYYLPGYLDVEVRDKALITAMELEGLEKKVNQQETYINNLRRVFAGEVDIDSTKIISSISVSENDPTLMKTELEKNYVTNYAEEEMHNLSVLINETDMPMTSTAFYKPVSGLVTQKFLPATQQYGVKINIGQRETIISVLEGTVIYAGYSATDKYMMQIQHNNGFVSIYKHASLLLKKAGDKVKTGEAIAIAEVNEENAKAANYFIIFELWFKGKAVDPQQYISF